MSDWFRNTDWTDDIEADFFERLGRARSQRDQYIVIQALTLAESHPKVALRLVDLYFETRSDTFDDGRARLAAARARFADGGYEDALDEFEAAIGVQTGGGSMLVASPLQFAFLTARYRSAKHYASALDMLRDLTPPERHALEPAFQYHAASALLLSETGQDPAGAHMNAEIALGFPEDLIGTFPDLLWRLRKIARR